MKRSLFSLTLLVTCLPVLLAAAPIRLSASSSEFEGTDYYVKVSISDCRLLLYKKTGGRELIPLKEYKVGTAVKGLPVYPAGKGRVTRIEIDPWWHPTENTREVFKRNKKIDLPKAVPPGDPANYMGSFKIHLSHRTERGTIYRIHGNNNAKRVGKRVTGGCICMDNKEGVELAKMIREGTEVEIVP